MSAATPYPLHNGCGPGRPSVAVHGAYPQLRHSAETWSTWFMLVLLRALQSYHARTSGHRLPRAASEEVRLQQAFWGPQPEASS